MLDQTAALIYRLFALTQEESRTEASDLLATIADHGGQADSWDMIDNLVRKKLGSRLTWRDPEAQEQEKARQASTTASYNDYLNKARSPWQRKW